MPISDKPIKIEITYSNLETSKLGVKAGDIFTAFREYYPIVRTYENNGKIEKKIVRKMKQACWFKVDGVDCVAYKCQHDEDARMLVTTCKIIE